MGMRRAEELVPEVTVVIIEVVLRTVDGAEEEAAAVPELVAASIAYPLEVVEAVAVAGIAVGEVAIGEEDAAVISRWTTLADQAAAVMGAGRAAVGINSRIMMTLPPTVGTLIIQPFQLLEVEEEISTVEWVQVEVYHMVNSRKECFFPPAS